MIRMPSLAFMKSLYAGGAEVTTAPRRLDCWRSRRVGTSGFVSGLLDCRKAEAVAASSKHRGWGGLLSAAAASSGGANFKSASAIFRTHRLNQRSASVMAYSLKQSAAVALDEAQGFDEGLDKFVDVAHKMADAAGLIIRQFFRTKIDILDKDDSSPVTVADKRAESAMTLIISQHFPTHGIYGEEGGLHMPEERTEYVWVLDPIDGTKSFITGKPLFGTLIALVHKGVPILGIIDQPVLGERWVGRAGKGTTLNGEPIASRSSISALKDAYLYSTSPHLFSGSKEAAFIRVRDKVKTPLYGCDCYAYGLLAAGYTDLVVESGLKPYDFLALVPVIEGAGGYITDWEGKSLRFWPTSEYPSAGEGGTEVAAAGSAVLHKAALAALAWT